MPEVSHNCPALPADQRAYWDGVAGLKTFTHPLDTATLQHVLPPTAALLDVGCGYGRVVRELRDLGYGSVVGVDSSRGMIEAGRTRHPDLDLRHLPSTALPCPDASVDGVFLIAVLTCIPSDAGQQALINEVQRVLKPGGWLHVSDYFLQPDGRNQARYRENLDRHGTYGIFGLDGEAVLRHHDPAWIDQLLASFQQHSLHELPVPTMNGHPSTVFQYWGQR